MEKRLIRPDGRLARRPIPQAGVFPRTLLVLAALPGASALGWFGTFRLPAVALVLPLVACVFFVAYRAGAPLPAAFGGAGLLFFATFTSLLAASGFLLDARGHRVEVSVSDVKRVHDKHADYWECTLDLVDDVPVSDDDFACRGPKELHHRVAVLVDPRGALDPMTVSGATSWTTPAVWSLSLSAVSAALLGFGTSSRFRVLSR